MATKNIVETSIVLRSLRFLFRKRSEFLQVRKFKDHNCKYARQLRRTVEALRGRSPARIVVVGNGPSLKMQNLDLLRNEFTICTNAFFHAYENLSWRPTIMTVEDPLPAADNADFYNSDNESTKLIQYDLRDIIAESESTAYLNFLRSYTHWSSRRWPRFSTNVMNCAYWGGTVSFLALQIAATFQPRQIILIGTDLSYIVPKSAKISGTVITSTEDDPNHFNPNYFGAGKRWHVPETQRMQRAFEYALQVLSNESIELLNATSGGNLRVVPRISYEESFT